MVNASADARIVLCRPSHPGNIGAAARAMKTMGLSDLRLVRPERYPAPEDQWMATNAADVLLKSRPDNTVFNAKFGGLTAQIRFLRPIPHQHKAVFRKFSPVL